MSAENVTPEQWESATYEGNRRSQLREWAKMSFADKIKWVEEAHSLAAAFDRARPLARLIVRGKSDAEPGQS